MTDRDTYDRGSAGENRFRALLDAVQSSTCFTSIEHVAETGSTNADLMALAKEGADEGRVLITDHQTAGQGRRDRTWEDTPGKSMLMSVLLRPDLPPERLGLLTVALGVAAARAVRALGADDVGLKWPNDLVRRTADGDLKLSGLLAQSQPEPTPAVVLGIGINVNWSNDDLAALPTPAASLAQIIEPPHPLELAAAVLRELDGLYPVGPGLVDAYRQVSATLGRQVRVDLGDRVVSGIAADVDANGLLLLDTELEGRLTISTGDVTSLRPMA